MANLSLKHLYKIYENGTKAVDDFNLEIKDNEFIVFVGPSGCGKSTTLRMIAGLEEITAGDFYIDGILANNLEPKDRDMAMVFQNYALYPHMSVYENMAFGLRIRHVNKDEIDRRVHEAAKILDIENQLDKKPKNMSGGQRQRVALGRAIVRKPKVFLLDEPLSNLDAKLRSSMRSEITRLHSVLGTTFIYVTHDQVEAMTMGTRIVVMKNGIIQQVDSPMNLYDYPENVFVAGFIGTPQMNFINAKLGYVNSDILLKSSFYDFIYKHEDLSHIDTLNILKEKDVIVGIRPEHTCIVNKNSSNAFECEIVVLEALGNEMNVIAETIADRTRIILKLVRDDSLSIGQHILVSFDVTKLHVFDKESENTLLERIPSFMTIKGRIENNKLNILGHKIKLSSWNASLFESNKDVLLNFSISALSEGEDFVIECIKKEKIKNKWLFTCKFNDEYVYFVNDNYIDGDKLSLNIDLSSIDYYDLNGNLLISKLDEINKFEGELIPSKKLIPCVKKNLIDISLYKNYLKVKEENDLPLLKKLNVKEKKKVVFNYKIFNKEIEPRMEDIIKIYALLGKKFYLHHIKYLVSAKDIIINEFGEFSGEIIEILDYNKEKFARIKLLNIDQSLLVYLKDSKFNVNDKINFSIPEEKIGLLDLDFNVRLI